MRGEEGYRDQRVGSEVDARPVRDQMICVRRIEQGESADHASYVRTCMNALVRTGRPGYPCAHARDRRETADRSRTATFGSAGKRLRTRWGKYPFGRCRPLCRGLRRSGGQRRRLGGRLRAGARGSPVRARDGHPRLAPAGRVIIIIIIRRRRRIIIIMKIIIIIMIIIITIILILSNTRRGARGATERRRRERSDRCARARCAQVRACDDRA